MLNKRPTRYPIGILVTIRQLTAAGAERVAINEMDPRQGEHFWEGATDEQKASGAEFWQELMRERQRRNCEAAQESGCESEGETVPFEQIAEIVLTKVRDGLAQSAAADLDEHFNTYDLQDRERRRTEHLTSVRLAFEARIEFCGGEGWADEAEIEAEFEADFEENEAAEFDASEAEFDASEAEFDAENGAENEAELGADEAEFDAVMIANLPYWNTSEEMITGMFEQVGVVRGVELDADDDTQERWAYVKYRSPEDAVKAVRGFDRVEFQGEFMEVSVCTWEDFAPPNLD